MFEADISTDAEVSVVLCLVTSELTCARTNVERTCICAHCFEV